MKTFNLMKATAVFAFLSLAFIFASKQFNHYVTRRVAGVWAEPLALVGVVCAMLCFPVVVGAQTITVTADLPDLLGLYEPGSFREEVFDLGVEFTEVHEASLSTTFSASTGIFESCSGIGCTPVGEDLFPGLLPFLRNPLDFFSSSGTTSSPTDLVDVEFEFFWRPLDLDRLLDGSDHVGMELNGIACIAEDTCFFSTQPTATISSASVTVTGVTVPGVPEPSTLVLVAIGLLATGTLRRHIGHEGRRTDSVG